MIHTVTNVSRGRGWRATALLLAVGLVPAGAVGYSAAPGLRWISVQRELEGLRRDADELPGGGDPVLLAAEHERLAKRHDVLLELDRSLESMVPASCDLIALFDGVRRAAERAEVRIQSINPGATAPLFATESFSESGDAVHATSETAATELGLLGSATLSELADFVRRLKGLGHPNEVRSLSLSAEGEHTDRFRFQLTLGMLHRSGEAVPGE